MEIVMSKIEFDEKTIQNLGYYVYMLIDPRNNQPFYIGKGIQNRVFDHLKCALTDIEDYNAKYDKIREIVESDHLVTHMIIRHGLSEKEAFQIEASLIDTLSYCGLLLSNKVSGHNSIEKGLMNSEEIKRIYNALPLDHIETDCIIININKKYQRAKDVDSIYLATKETWLLSKNNLPKIKYVLSEYKGLIVEVFEIKEWYEKQRTKNKMINGVKTPTPTIGYGFNGIVAPNEIRDLYINKSIAHHKKLGSAQAFRYKL